MSMIVYFKQTMSKRKRIENMTKLQKQLKVREWIYVLVALIFIVVQVWMDLKMLDYMKLITQIAQGKVLHMSYLIYR